MYNPDAYSDSMKQLGRRDGSEPVVHHEGVLCPPCLNREHGIASDCWHGDCACRECNVRAVDANSRMLMNALGGHL